MLALKLESVFTGSYRRPLLDRTRNNSAPTCRVAHLHVACVGIHDTVLIGWSKYSIQLTSHCGGRDCLTASLNYILADMQFANLGRLWIMCVVYLIRHRSIQYTWADEAQLYHTDNDEQFINGRSEFPAHKRSISAIKTLQIDN